MWHSKLRQITIAQFGRLLPYLPLYVAQRRGFFEKEGLHVKIINANCDESTWNMVVSGSAQFGVADPLLMVEDSKTRGVVIAALLQRSANYGLAQKPQHHLVSPETFSGKKIAVFRSPSTSFALLRRICQQCAKNNVNEPEIVEIEFTTELGYLRRSDIDLVLMTEPSATVAELQGSYRVFSGPRYFDDILYTGLFATSEYVTSNPKIAQSVVNAVENAIHLIHRDHSAALSVAIEEFPDVERTTIELATLRLFADNVFPKKTTISDQSWYALREIRSNSLDMPLIQEYVNNTFATNAGAMRPPSTEFIILKPGIWGCSIDIKALWRNLMRKRHSQD